MVWDQRRRGFTMIELLVVVTIIAILTAIGIVSFTSTNQRARDAKRIADLNQVRTALEQYKTDTSVSSGYYPDCNGGNSISGFSTMESALSTKGYLSNPVPVDPVGQGNGGYQNYSYYFAPGAPVSCTSMTTFCLCAPVENRSNGNNNSGVCGASSAAPANFYCVQNP